MNTNIEGMSEIELKAIKSDLYEGMERMRGNLQVINSELARRLVEAKKTSGEVVSVNKKENGKKKEGN